MDNVPPQGMPPGQPPGDPTAGMPYPPSVFPTSDAPGNPHEMGGRPPFNQGTPQQLMEYPQVPVPQGAPPGQPPVDPTAGQGAMSPVVPQDEGFPEGAVDPRTQADLPALGQNFNAQFTKEESDQRIKSGEDDQNRKKTEAAIATAAAMEPLSNDAGGQDASTDPMMWKVWNQLSENPAARKADYLRRMNMLILGGIMLDAMASAMGVESEAGRYIDAQLKMMEAEQKFDDQSRIYELGRSIYYNEEGVYSPPGSQKEAFDRLMQSGATIQEASAMSSKHPEAKAAKGYKEYWKIEANPDGIHENIFLATGQIPPPGYTGKSPNNAIGTVNEGQDIRNLGEIRRLKAAAAELFAAGDIPGANRLNEEAQLLTNMTGGNKGTPAGWHTIWSATHGSMAKQAATDGRPFPHNTYRRPGNDASYIPWPIFQQEWLESESMTVKDGSGKDITIPGYRGLVALGKTGLTQSAPQMNASELNMDTMRANLAARIESYPPGSTQINIDITSFIKAFGVQELQIKYGGEFE